MKTLILQGSLKKEGLSNTQVLSEFFAQKLQAQEVECEIIRLAERNILPGTYLDMGAGDEWPEIFEKILAADIVVFATPVWWGNHSSLMQRVIERLDEVHDEILEGKKSKLDGKLGGIIVTGGSDGAQHIIGNIANFFNAIGITLPPYATLTVLWEGHRKEATTTREDLVAEYEKEYTKTAEEMVRRLMAAARA